MCEVKSNETENDSLAEMYVVFADIADSDG